MNKILTLITTLMISLSAFAGNPDTQTASKEHISESEALFLVTGQDIIDNARQYIGTPYRYGGKTPRAFDCSGFTSYVYKTLNIRLNCSSRSQYTEGISVDRDDVKVGDLVFFAGRNRRGGVGHVGIVSKVNDNGNFDFIHASCSEGVTISNISESYYSNRYKGARRIVADYSDVLAMSK